PVPPPRQPAPHFHGYRTASPAAPRRRSPVSERITVLGAGSWGTALAIHCARVGRDGRLWGRDAALMASIAATRRNERYLPDIAIGANVRTTAALADALAGAPIVLAAVPSHGMRHVLRDARPFLAAGAVVVSATKGLETASLARMSQLIAEEAPGHPVAVLSGPSFAVEVARGMPTAVVVASGDPSAAARVQECLKGPAFRLYA